MKMSTGHQFLNTKLLRKAIVCIMASATFGTLLAEDLQIAAEKPWQETADNGAKCYALDYSGQAQPGLSFPMTIKPDSYYTVSWKMKGSIQEDSGVFGIELILGGKTETAEYVLTKDWSEYVLYFYSEGASDAKIRLRLNPGKPKTIAIKDIKAGPVTAEQFTKNLLPDGNFESASGIPSNWVRSGSSNINPAKIVTQQGFISGEKSLEVAFIKQAEGQCGIQSIFLPVVPGKDYEFNFWAKAERPQMLSVSMDVIGFTRKVGVAHFYKRDDFKVTPEWKAYSFKTTEIPSDIAQFPDLQNRLLIIHIRWEEKDQDGKVWFDDMSFHETGVK